MENVINTVPSGPLPPVTPDPPLAEPPSPAVPPSTPSATAPSLTAATSEAVAALLPASTAEGRRERQEVQGPEDEVVRHTLTAKEVLYLIDMDSEAMCLHQVECAWR